MIAIGSYFVFNGRRSTDFDIIVEKQPDIIRPEKQVSTFTVPGRSGNLYYDEQSFKNMTKTVECAILSVKYLDEIAAWLCGAGSVIFSNEKTKLYNAFIKNQIPFTQVFANNYKKFIVQFDCQPFKYSVNSHQDFISLNAPAQFRGKGTFASAPVIEIFGSGDITLVANDVTVVLKDVSESIVINSEILDCYKGDMNLNYKMTGEFPFLLPGMNNISWSGNVSVVNINPSWRWL